MKKGNYEMSDNFREVSGKKSIQKSKKGGILAKIRECNFSLENLTIDYPELELLKHVPQNPQYHAEGDVYCHTGLVCREITKLKEWPELASREQELLFLAGAFHDIGKPACTRWEDERWTSPNHTIIGEKVFRAMVYRECERFGLTWQERELAAKLIRYHGFPVWFWKKRRPDFELLKAAETVPMRLLHLLSMADIKGRRCKEPEPLDEYVEMFWESIKELEITNASYPFANTYTRYQYFHKDSLWQGSELYDDTTFDVWLMSGLPLSGKDTWIETYGKGMPIISLDNIREEYEIAPGNNSSKVAHIATDRAKKFLRKKEPFIWNATNIIQDIREKLCNLFTAYGARVKIIYLEVPYQELLIRNEKRTRHIPIQVLEHMIDKLEIPAPWESYSWERWENDICFCRYQSENK